MEQIKDIIADIRKEKCVLIIGPDIVDFGKQTFFEAMCAELMSNVEYMTLIDKAPQYIFAH